MKSFAAALTAPGAAGLATGQANRTDESDKFHDESVRPELPNPDTTVHTYDDSLYQITSQPHLLAISDDAIDRHFDASSLEGKEFETAKQYVTSLRKRYPSETVEEGNEVVHRVSSEGRRNLDSEKRSGASLVEASGSKSLPAPHKKGIPAQQSAADHAALKATVKAFADKGFEGHPGRGNGHSDDSGGGTGKGTTVGFGKKGRKKGQGFGKKPSRSVEAHWNPDHHPILLEEVADDVDYSGEFYNWAKTPDEFSDMINGQLGLGDGHINVLDGPDYISDKVNNAVGTAFQQLINKTFDNYTQYYEPDPLTIPVGGFTDIEIEDIGMAPAAADYIYGYADQYSSGSYYNRRYTAYVSHYIQDMGNPLHAGMGAEQAGAIWDVSVETNWSTDPIDIDLGYTATPNEWLHYGFEGLIKSSWDSLSSSYYKGWYTPTFEGAGDAVRSVAQLSTDYANSIFHTIYENEGSARSSDASTWSTSTRTSVRDEVENSISRAGAYNRSLLVDQDLGERPNPPCTYRCYN